MALNSFLFFNGCEKSIYFPNNPKNNRVTQKKVLISSPCPQIRLTQLSQCNAMLLGSETGWTQLIKKELEPYEQFVAFSKPHLV